MGKPNIEHFYKLLFLIEKHIDRHMASVVDYLTQIQTLTNTNLQILKTLNDSFYTKQNHLFTEIDNTTYVIPSFISLENKINALQENFENLVKAPETCEAYFNFDGNTRAIEVRKYSHVPDSLTLSNVSTFDVESNDIFKDFMTPVPYVNLDLPTLPNDIVKVNVKKIVAKNNELKELFKSKLVYNETYTDDEGKKHIVTKYRESANTSYGELYKTLLNYKEDVDFVEYDTLYDLPIRKNLGTATYVIESVVSDVIDKDLDEYITIKLRKDLKDTKYSNKLTYKMFDDTIEKSLQVGDELINFDGTGKVVVTEVRTSTNTIVVKVVNGEYLNFVGTDSYDTDNDNDIHDLSKLRFHTAYDFEANKYVKIPLEEDQYVFIAVAPLNSRMNVQSGWGTGIVLNTYALKMGDKEFKAYYDENVKNIGDVLFEMTSMITSPVTELSQGEYNILTTSRPALNVNDLTVLQINKHLNNSNTVKNIRDAYSQKKTSEKDLTEVQGKIDDINRQLSSLSFDDTTGLRSVYTSQLSELNSRKNELTTVITKAIDSISMSVNSAEIPIENAKYHIRGFYVPNNLGIVKNENLADHVIGIQVQYRYKNMSVDTGNAISMTGPNNETYIYSDWNVMQGFNKRKVARCVNGVYSYEYESSNENINEPSYNQIDIPISQGESVDIRIRVLYDYGQPYISMTSEWSDIINVPFPTEYAKDVPILTIIEENNSDIESNRFSNILKDGGVDGHIKDSITDQDITYYHRPDSIASGFYTAERRVIPLKDKLQSMSNDIAKILSEVAGADELLTVSVSTSDSMSLIHPDQLNTISLTSYSELVKKVPTDMAVNSSATIGGYEILKTSNGYKVSTILNLTIANTSDNVVKLFSLVPGSRDEKINNIKFTKIDKADYTDGNGGVHYDWIGRGTDSNTLQKGNQFITFRTKDPWTGESYYSSSANETTDGQQSSTTIPTSSNLTKTGFAVYPYLSTKYGLCFDTNEVRSNKIVNPNTEIVIPIKCDFTYMDDGVNEITKYISFDIKTSLYREPMNYLIKFIVKKNDTIDDKVYKTHKSTLLDKIIDPIKYRIVGQ